MGFAASCADFSALMLKHQWNFPQKHCIIFLESVGSLISRCLNVFLAAAEMRLLVFELCWVPVSPLGFSGEDPLMPYLRPSIVAWGHSSLMSNLLFYTDEAV